MTRNTSSILSASPERASVTRTQFSNFPAHHDQRQPLASWLRWVIGPCSKARLAFVVGVLSLAAGCVSPRQYRRSELFVPSAEITNNHCFALEKMKEYTLGIVEIDDQGWLWDRQQLNFVRNELGREASNTVNGVQLFIFVHGWQHDAAPEDENLKSFREMLVLLDKIEERKHGDAARRTIGLYVGWRGKQCPVPVMYWGTFWDSKSAAHEVGRGALTEVFLQMERLLNGKKRQQGTNSLPSRLVVIGHSFGGAATYSALAPILMERLVQPHRTEGDKPSVRGFGDLVALINPAFEAARLAVLRDAAFAERTNAPHLRMGLTILTSKEDTATKWAFPIGRRFSALFQTHPKPDEFKANITAVGHYDHFITHDLRKSDSMSGKIGEMYKKKTKAEQQSFARTYRKEIAQEMEEQIQEAAEQGTDPASIELAFTTMNRRTNGISAPIRVVAVDKKVIPDHSKFDRLLMVYFLADYLAYTEAVNSRWKPGVAGERAPP